MKETLLDYLKRPNPEIIHLERNGKKHSKSQTKTPQYVSPTLIKRWQGVETQISEDLRSAALGACKERTEINIDTDERRIRGEEGFGDIVFKWNKDIVTRALEECGTSMNRDMVIKMIRGYAAENCPGSGRSLYPDWAAVKSKTGMKELDWTSIMPGDSKYSKNWRSSEIHLGRYDDGNELPGWFGPVSQIFTYCYRLKTRYGYLITDEELVICRIGPRTNSAPHTPRTENLELEATASDGQFEFFSIPWRNERKADCSEDSEQNFMTVNAALWWIHIQAATDKSIKWTYEAAEDDRGLSSKRDSVTEETQTSISNDTFTDDRYDEYYHSFHGSQNQSNEFRIPGQKIYDNGTVSGKRGRSSRRTKPRHTKADGSFGDPPNSQSQASAASGDTEISQRSTRSKRKLRPAQEKHGMAGRGKRKKS